jgi:deoxyribodipyrimidine photo-lyase
LIQKNTDIIRRSRSLHPGKRGQGPVIYWMERDQRIDDNWAMLYAQQEALIREKPLLVLFFIPPKSRGNHPPQNVFQAYGLKENIQKCKNNNIGYFIYDGDAEKLLPQICDQLDCHLLVTDFSPLHAKQSALLAIGKNVTVPVVEVDAHNIIPAWLISSKKEYAAYTIRPKIHRLLDDYLTEFPKISKHPVPPAEIKLGNLPEITHSLGSHLDGETGQFRPGHVQATQQMQSFIANGLNTYEQDRNNPNLNGQSELSCYLHFGQLGPQRLAHEVSHADCDKTSKESFLEELVVRRELADNFCLYEKNYDRFAGFHPWAQKSLNEHRNDKREYTYTLRQLEHGETHEELWNSCQRNLVTSNKLHGFLRMYWAKKILEWTASPEEALEYAIFLNDTYSIDGTDPNGYTGVAWSIGGVHDRAWPERPVYGKIRYMNERGCRRKFDVDRYIAANSS